MEKDIQHIDQLLYRYIDKTATESEAKELLEWVGQSEENKAYFIQQIDAVRSLQSLGSHSNESGNWEKIQKKTRVKSSQVVKYLIAVSAVAASIAIYLSVGVFNTAPNDKFAKIAIIEHIATDSVKSVLLADSSSVFINKASTLSAPEQFSGTSREVAMQGDCYFEVARNPEKPFRVTVGFVTVEVLGTKFSIHEDSLAHSITVSLLEGKVCCTDNRNSDTVILTDNMQYTFYKNRTGKTAIQSLEHKNPIAWKTGTLEFNNTPLDIATSQIEEFFGKEIVFADSSMKHCALNAKLHKYAFENVLTMFNLAFGFTVEQQGDTVLLVGEGCPQEVH